MDRAEIRRRRRAHGLSQKELGQMTGILPFHLRKIENGQRIATPAELSSILAIVSAATPLERFQSLRQEKGWSTHRVAAMFDITSSAIQSWDNGSSIPRPENRAKIDEILTTHEMLKAQDERDDRARDDDASQGDIVEALVASRVAEVVLERDMWRDRARLLWRSLVEIRGITAEVPPLALVRVESTTNQG